MTAIKDTDKPPKKNRKYGKKKYNKNRRQPLSSIGNVTCDGAESTQNSSSVVVENSETIVANSEPLVEILESFVENSESFVENPESFLEYSESYMDNPETYMEYPEADLDSLILSETQSSVQNESGTEKEEDDKIFNADNYFKPETKTSIEMESKCLPYKLAISVYCERNQADRDFEKKFAVFMECLDPVFRANYGIEIVEHDISSIVEAMNNAEVSNFWPFGVPGFTTNSAEMKKIFARIVKLVQMCFMFACYERGYSYTVLDKKHEYSMDTFETIDAFAELEILKSISVELNTLCIENEWTEEVLSFTSPIENIFNVLMPALEKFDNDVLHMNGIMDKLASIPSRKKIGFEISAEEVDKMLTTSLQMRGFGDFTVTVTECVDVFTTVNQLEKILEKSEEIMLVMDLRCGYAVLKSVTHIFSMISSEECSYIFEKYADTPKSLITRFLGSSPNENNSGKPELQPLKPFYTALSIVKTDEPYYFDVVEMSSAIKAIYLLFHASEVNQMILQILSDNDLQENSRVLCQALDTLPDCLKEKLEIGESYFNGDLNENCDSIYHQIAMQLNKQGSDNFILKIVHVSADANILSHERIIRMCMKSIDIRDSKNTQSVILILLEDDVILNLNFSADFVQDLVLFALKVYSYPVEIEKSKKHEFINHLLVISDNIFKTKTFFFDKSYLTEMWKELNYPWFVELYFTKKFDFLNFYSTNIEYPWKSQLDWDASETTVPVFSELVLLLTAWPYFDDVSFLLECSNSILPSTIDRLELIKKMMVFVEKIEIDESWKSRIIHQLESTVSRMKEEVQIENITIDDSVVEEQEQIVEPVEEVEIGEVEEECVEMDEEREKEIVPLPENKDEYLKHLGKEYWIQLTASQKSIIKQYRSEFRAQNN